ncbi:MAG: haloacid dehalogenase type II [Pseudomonadota bacterium]
MKFVRTPKWLTFDCYGTLIDTKKGYTEVWRDILAGKGITAESEVVRFVGLWGTEEFRLVQGPYKKYRDILKESVERTLTSNGLKVSEGDGQKLADKWGTFKPYPDVKPVLTDLKKNVKLAIISNGDNDILKQSVAGIEVEFDEVFTAEQCQAYKPSRIPFEFALGKMNVDPRDVLHVAFGYQYDHSTASEMGFMTLWVNRRELTLPEGARKFDMEIAALAELPGLINFK